MIQLNLFEESSYKQFNFSQLLMDKDELLKWKEKLYNYQQKVLQENIIQQSLFNLTPTHYNSNDLNPFELKRYSPHFYRMPETGDNCLIYFIIDDTLPIILYVGETKRTAKQRWVNHDCKSYIMSYKQLHRKYNLPNEVNASFWFDTPQIRKHRLTLERELILKFRTPFNKECWQYWGQPFGK
jgi:hypothetical protein